MNRTIDTTTQQLITEVAHIIGLPIIPMVPTAVHDSKPFPHLVQHPGGNLFLDGQLFDPTQPQHFLLVEAWLVRKNISHASFFLPADAEDTAVRHGYNVDEGSWHFGCTRPLAGVRALIHQYGDDRLLKGLR